MPWVVLALVVATFLIIGSSPKGGGPTDVQRANAIDSVIRCPSCQDLSVAESSAPTALAVRSAVMTRVREGQSTAQIEAFLVDRYGPSILLRPPTSGLTLLVWLLPILAVLASIVGLGVLFWRRRRSAPQLVSDDDRLLVEAAMLEAGLTGEGPDGSR